MIVSSGMTYRVDAASLSRVTSGIEGARTVSVCQVAWCGSSRLLFEALSAQIRAMAGFAVCGMVAGPDREPLTTSPPDVIVAEATSAEDLASLQQRYPTSRIVALTTDLALGNALASWPWRAAPTGSLAEFLGVLREAAGLNTTPTTSEGASLSSFNRRDLDVLQRLARGESVKEVAQHLGMSFKAVDSLKYRIMRKLQLTDRVQLTRFAIRTGLISP